MGFGLVLDYLNRPLVPQWPLRLTMRWWGRKLGAPFIAGPVLIAMLVVLVAIVAVGVPKIEVNQLSQADWSPQGGEMERQLKLVNELKPNGVQSFTACHIMVSSTNKENLLDNPKKWLGYLHKVLLRVHNITQVKASNGRMLGWDDMCRSLSHPLINMLSGGADTPCINPSALDGFSEGAWQYAPKPGTVRAVKTIQATACAVGGDLMCGLARDQSVQKSFMNMTDDEIIDALSFHSEHWLKAGSNPMGTNFGNYAMDSKGRLTYVETFTLWALHADAQLIIHNRDSAKNLTQDQFREANMEYLLELERNLGEADADEAAFPGAEILFHPSNAMDRMYAEVAAGQIKTFLVGYGVMLVYVVVSQFSMKFPFVSFVAFAGFLLVILANLAAYGFAELIGLEFNHTMTQALPFLALGLGVDDLFVLLHRFREQLGKNVKNVELIGGMMEEGGGAVTITSMCNAFVFLSGFTVPIPALRAFLSGAVIIVIANWVVAMTMIPAVCSLTVWAWRLCSRTDENVSVKESTAEATGIVSKAVFSLYGVMARSLVSKLSCLVVGLAFVVICGVQIPSVEMGFDYTDLAKEGTYLARGIEHVWAQHYSQDAAQTFIFGPGTNYSAQQKNIYMANYQLKTSQWAGNVMPGFRLGGWLENMLASPGICPNQKEEFISEINATVPLCPAEEFYDQYHLWRKPATMLPSGAFSFGSVLSNFYNVQHFAYTTNDTDYSPSNHIVLGYDRMIMKMKALKTTKDYVTMLKDLKKICKSTGIDVWMSGWTTVQYEQFLELETEFWKTFGISVAVVFGVSLLLGLTVLGAFLMSFLSAALTLEVYGCMAFFDLRFQALMATSTLMALGMAVEFTAHPIVAYDFSVGSRDERLVEAMKKSAIPVMEGAASSVVGYLMLLFSDFPYVRKYFFTVYMLMIGLGCFNGLVLLPSILGLLGRASKSSGLPVVNVAVVPMVKQAEPEEANKAAPKAVEAEESKPEQPVYGSESQSTAAETVELEQTEV